MRGMLADINVQGLLPYLQRLLVALHLWPLLLDQKLTLATFAEIQFPRDLDDRSLWSRCQADGWVLFTENRNHDGPDSLQATLADAWQLGQLPVLTLANKQRFEKDRAYGEQVAIDVAELLYGVAQGEYRDQARIYVPR